MIPVFMNESHNLLVRMRSLPGQKESARRSGCGKCFCGRQKKFAMKPETRSNSTAARLADTFSGAHFGRPKVTSGPWNIVCNDFPMPGWDPGWLRRGALVL